MRREVTKTEWVGAKLWVFAEWRPAILRRALVGAGAMELVGDGVKLVGANEMVTEKGERRATAATNRASESFTSSFTRSYPQLADASPIYADLRNLIDVAVACAFIQQQDYCTKAGWKMEFLGHEKSFTIENYTPPETAESAINVIWKNNTLTTPIGGGVEIRAGEALEHDNLLTDEKGEVAKQREKATIKLAEGQWWWDAK